MGVGSDLKALLNNFSKNVIGKEQLITDFHQKNVALNILSLQNNLKKMIENLFLLMKIRVEFLNRDFSNF